MWILPKNYPLSSAFAQGMVASKEDLTLQGLNIESSLMWRSKPTPLPTWLRKWNKGGWSQHLFTRILKPSQHTSFETKLALSLAVIPVNHSAHQEIGRAKATPDTCGLTLGDTLNQLDLFSASLKMSKGISVLDSAVSLAIWNREVISQRMEYSQRLKLARLTKEKGFISWPTPTASDWKNMDTANQKMLSSAVKWPTPTAHLAKEGGYPAEWTRNTPSLTVEAMKAEDLPHSSGHLNPEWVEWLMGVPTEWTDLGSWGTE